MAETNKVGVFVGVFIALIVGIVLLSSLSDSVYENSNTYESINETIAIGLNSGTTAEDDVITVTNFNNITDDLTASVNTDVNFTRAGVITINNDSIPPVRNFNITYGYEGDLYIRDAPARVINNLVIIFFALALLATAILAAYQMGLLEFLKKE